MKRTISAIDQLEIRPPHPSSLTIHDPTHKATIQKALKTLFKFQRLEHGTDVEWEPVASFTDNSGTHQPRDFLTRAERRRVKEAALEYGSIPNYNSLTPAERDRCKAHLA